MAGATGPAGPALAGPTFCSTLKFGNALNGLKGSLVPVGVEARFTRCQWRPLLRILAGFLNCFTLASRSNFQSVCLAQERALSAEAFAPNGAKNFLGFITTFVSTGH